MNTGLIACFALAAFLGAYSAPQPSDTVHLSTDREITEDVLYGHKDGLAMVLNVYQPAEPNGLGIIFINSGGWRSPFWDLVSDDAKGGRRLL